MQIKFDAIVIGSGIAGSTAANYLATNDYKVLVLEAEDYIGGRTKSSSVVWPLTGKSVQFDQGASWLHQFQPDFPLCQLAKKCGIQLSETHYDNSQVFDEKGKSLENEYDPQSYAKFMQQVSKKDGKNIEECILKTNSAMLNDPKFMNYITIDVEAQKAADICTLRGKKQEESEEQDEQQEYYDQKQYQEKGNEKIKKDSKGVKKGASKKQQGEQEYQQVGKEMFVVNGYSKIAQHLIQHPNIKVMLSKPVISVKRDPTKQRSTVTCQNGDLYKSPIIICSVPLGVLKKRSIKFVPQLPPLKMEAIDSIGFGHLYKVFILVNKPVPKSKTHIFNIVANNVNNRGFSPIIYNLEAMAGVPGYVAMLTSNLANGDAYNMSQQKFNKILATKLSACLQTEILPSELTVRRGKWLSNPHFNGTYTYEGVKTKNHHFKDIARPVFMNQWYFCGEHTHFKERSTTYGAYSSGINTGMDIVEEINKEDWKYRKY